jgi:hypothetical protein
MMRVLKIVPAPDASKIHCTACDEESEQAGIGVRPEAIKDGVVDTSDAKPLCDACTRLLLVGVEGGV